MALTHYIWKTYMYLYSTIENYYKVLYEKHVLIFIKVLIKEFWSLKSVSYHLNHSSTIMFNKMDVNQIFPIIPLVPKVSPFDE